jgi:pimeloyl-ACP methyl ester carboxylesterase
MQSNSKTITVRGRRFAYEVGGTANDAVMFVHGSGFSGAMWMPFARSLEPRMRSVMVDLLGYGHSAHVRQGDVVGPDLDLAMLEEVARRELPTGGPPVGGKIHIVAHSYGANLAARLALAKPALVRSLVLIEPVLFAALRVERPNDCVGELEGLYGDGRILDPSFGGSEEWTRRFYDYWTGKGAWALLTPRQRELQLEVAWKSFCEVRDASLDPRPFAAYGALPKPLLLVGGDRTTACAQRILGRLGDVTGAVVHVVPSATHFLPITHGPELLELLLRLWSIPQESISKAFVGAM